MKALYLRYDKVWTFIGLQFERLKSIQEKKELYFMQKPEDKYNNFLIFVCAFLYASSMAAKGIFKWIKNTLERLWSTPLKAL